MSTEIPAALSKRKDLDPELWWEEVNPSETLTDKQVTTYIYSRTTYWAQQAYRDKRLWREFHEDFLDWTKPIFKQAPNIAVKELRNLLRSRGVWVDNDFTIVDGLVKLLEDKQPAIWPQQDLEDQMADDEGLDSVLNPNSGSSVRASASQTPRPMPNPNASDIRQRTTYPFSHPPFEQDDGSQRARASHTPTPEEAQETLVQAALARSEAAARTGAYQAFDSTASKAAEALGKLYIGREEHKYEGGLYDNLENKLLTFRSFAKIVGLSPEHFHTAFPLMLRGAAFDFYMSQVDKLNEEFIFQVQRVKTHFQNTEYKQRYLSEWRTTTLPRIILDNPAKSKAECLELLINKLTTLQKGLGDLYQRDYVIRDQLISAVDSVPECMLALFRPGDSFEECCQQLRSAVGTWTRMNPQTALQQQFNTGQGIIPADNVQTHTGIDENGAYYVERRYQGSGGRLHGGGNRFQGNNNRNPGESRSKTKSCYVCGRENCWSTKHTSAEKEAAFEKFKSKHVATFKRPTTRHKYQSFLVGYEGIEGANELESDPEIELLMADLEIEAPAQNLLEYPASGVQGAAYMTEIEDVYEFTAETGPQAVALLADQATEHALTGSTFELESAKKQDMLLSRYGNADFQGILPDSGAATISTAGIGQVEALAAHMPIDIDESAPKKAIKFGIGSALSKGTITIPTPIGDLTFYVMPTQTPFLLCLQDMDKAGVIFDNLRNLLIQGQIRVPIIRKWNHPWMMLPGVPMPTVGLNPGLHVFLSEQELRRLHRRWGHPSIERAITTLERSGHDDPDHRSLLEELTKRCKHCQLYGSAPGRFKFTLKQDSEFNYSVYLDIFDLDGKPCLQIVDYATSFQAARFLKDQTAATVFKVFKECWIDTYLGPPDLIVHDAGKNLVAKEFQQSANGLGISTKEAPVEAHNSVGKVERYHAPLRRAFTTIKQQLRESGDTLEDLYILQMAVKAINDTAGPGAIVPTLLVFGAYPKISESSPPTATTFQRSQAVKKAMAECREYHASRQVSDALGMRNGPNVLPVLSLPLGSEVRVWREKGAGAGGRGGWKGPYNLLAVHGQDCVIELPSGPTTFRSTVVRPWFEPEHQDQGVEDRPEEQAPPEPVQEDLLPKAPELPRRGRGRPRKYPPGNFTVDATYDWEFTIEESDLLQEIQTFMSAKEQADLQLSIELRKAGKITTPGKPFEASGQAELEALLARGVYELIELGPEHANERIFNSRMVNTVKGGETPFEKTRLVIQAWKDAGKEFILTQAPTIQRASQRLMAALAPTLMLLGFLFWLRDITQAYTQAKTHLERLVLARLPKEIAHLYPRDVVMRMLKPLYGIPEAGTHWFKCYLEHLLHELQMETSTYDTCLLISKAPALENQEEITYPQVITYPLVNRPIGIIGLQVDDTLILSNLAFKQLEEEKRAKAKFDAKPTEQLSEDNPLIYNGAKITKEGTYIGFYQNNQGLKLALIDPNTPTYKEEYRKQRARGAYIASICQPEASFDLSVAAQHQDPSEKDVLALNKRLKWQIENMHRGIRYIPLLSDYKLFVFVDGSFANNEDMSSQIGYVIILATEADGKDSNTAELTGNLLHWSSTKCKRVTRSVLASEIYGMVSGVDMAIALSTTLNQINKQINSSQHQISTVVLTDSYSLYQCLVKLGTTAEKRLMVDIMALRQSYENRELSEVRWINNKDNLADAMTKRDSNKALELFLDSNKAMVRMEGWVDREKSQ